MGKFSFYKSNVIASLVACANKGGDSNRSALKTKNCASPLYRLEARMASTREAMIWRAMGGNVEVGMRCIEAILLA